MKDGRSCQAKARRSKQKKRIPRKKGIPRKEITKAKGTPPKHRTSNWALRGCLGTGDKPATGRQEEDKAWSSGSWNRETEPKKTEDSADRRREQEEKEAWRYSSDRRSDHEEKKAWSSENWREKKGATSGEDSWLEKDEENWTREKWGRNEWEKGHKRDGKTWTSAAWTRETERKDTDKSGYSSWWEKEEAAGGSVTQKTGGEDANKAEDSYQAEKEEKKQAWGSWNWTAARGAKKSGESRWWGRDEKDRTQARKTEDNDANVGADGYWPEKGEENQARGFGNLTPARGAATTGGGSWWEKVEEDKTQVQKTECKDANEAEDSYWPEKAGENQGWAPGSGSWSRRGESDGWASGNWTGERNTSGWWEGEEDNKDTKKTGHTSGCWWENEEDNMWGAGSWTREREGNKSGDSWSWRNDENNTWASGSWKDAEKAEDSCLPKKDEKGTTREIGGEDAKKAGRSSKGYEVWDNWDKREQERGNKVSTEEKWRKKGRVSWKGQWASASWNKGRRR